MNNPPRQTDPDGPPETPAYQGDRPYTIQVTIISLVIGVVLATASGLLLYGLNQPATATGAQVTLTVNALGFPLAILVSGIVLAVAVFWLPVRLARRAGRVLDPTLYPMVGVVSLAAIIVGVFFVAIAFQVI